MGTHWLHGSSHCRRSGLLPSQQQRLRLSARLNLEQRACGNPGNKIAGDRLRSGGRASQISLVAENSYYFGGRLGCPAVIWDSHPNDAVLVSTTFGSPNRLGEVYRYVASEALDSAVGCVRMELEPAAKNHQGIYSPAVYKAGCSRPVLPDAEDLHFLRPVAVDRVNDVADKIHSSILKEDEKAANLTDPSTDTVGGSSRSRQI